MSAQTIGQLFSSSNRNSRRRMRRIATTIGVALSAGIYPSHYQHHPTLVAASPSRAYPHGCSSHPPSYYDYDSMQFPPANRPDLVRRADEFGLTRRLGAGKFSDVFEAVDVLEEERILAEKSPQSYADKDGAEDVIDPRTLVVIKCLKPVSDRKVRRELLVLTHASSLPNLARLRGIVVPETSSKTNEKSDSSSPADALRGGGGKVAATAAVSSRARNAATMPSLVLEHAGRESRWLCHGRGTDSKPQHNIVAGKKLPVVDDADDLFLSEYEIKYYLFHLLVALDALHSRGIMHRDVKPRNVLINRSATHPLRGGTFISSSANNANVCSSTASSELSGERNSLMLVDLGLADFYLPGQRYNVRVASRHYKAPELLVGNELYDYAVDLWGVGCVLAGLLFRREPFFRGKDNVDQLGKIVAVLGPNDLLDYCDRVGVELTPELEASVSKYAPKAGPDGTRRPWHHFVGGACPMPGDDALDLLTRLLVYDHSRRLTAREAMAHPFFDEVRTRVKDEIRLRSRDRHRDMSHAASTTEFNRGDWRRYIETYQKP